MSDEKERATRAEAAIAKAKAELEAAEARLVAYLEKQGVTLKFPESLRQRGLEQLMAAIRKHGGAEPDITNYERNGAQVRAACEVGWIDGLTVDEVDTTHPRVVMWIASKINDIIVAAWELPGE